MEYKASLACQVRTNIRCKNEMSYQTLTQILKKEIPYEANKHQKYLLGFFEECYPSLVKKYMLEQQISRNQILDALNRVPDFGETFKFRKAVENGEF